MKKIVWKNKSNGQLCVTIPKNSGICDGDIISIEKENISIVVYTPIIGDMFHYGHLQLLEKANSYGDLHIAGVITDEAVKTHYKNHPISNYKERSSIISSLRSVDMILTQEDFSPLITIQKIRDNFRNSKIIIVYGSNWKEIPEKEKIEKIKDTEIVQPKYYEKLSDEIINKKFKKKIENEQ